MRPRIRHLLLLAVAAAALLATSTSAESANTSIVVTATIPTSLEVDTTACQTDTSATSFGAVQTNTARFLTGCSVTFRSNTTSSLKVFQQDNLGSAMWMTTSGTLDLPYGGGGTASRTQIVGSAPSYGYDATVLPDGRAVVVGTGTVTGNQDVGISRFTTSGLVDMTNTFAVGTGADKATSVVALADGTMYICGVFAGPANDDVFIARVKPDGTLDTASGFGGGDGLWTWDGGAGNDELKDCVVQPDGMIVAAGWSRVGGTLDFLAARIKTDGTPDAAFGVGGIRTVPVLAANDQAQGVLLNGDGSIILTGEADTGVTAQDFAAVKLDGTGSVVTGWGTSGAVTQSIGTGADWGYGSVLQSDGKVVIGGLVATVAGGNDMGFARFTTGGVLDTTFGVAGIRTVDVAPGTGADSLLGMSRLPDDRLMASGFSANGGNKFALVRLTSAGALDTSLAGTGKLVTSLGGSAGAPVLEQDGRVVLGGGSGSSHAVLRLDATAIDDYRNVGDATDRDWSSGGTTGFFGMCASSLTNLATGWAAGACTTSDGTGWIPAAANGGAPGVLVGANGTPGTWATAAIRFGLRTSTSQAAGAYLTPLTFQFMAP